MRSPCWLVVVNLLMCQHGTFTVDKQARRKPCQCEWCLQGISFEGWEGQGSPLPPVLCTTFAIVTGPGRHLTTCTSVSVPEPPACPSPGCGAAGLLTLHAMLDPNADSDAAGPSMPVSPGMSSPQRNSAKGHLSSSPRRQQTVPLPGSAAWPPRSPLSTQCPNGVRRSLSKPRGTSIGAATRSHAASENIDSNP